MLLSISRTFNPLCLAEGESYVTDYGVIVNGQRGRLRLGSKSLVFDPDDVVQDLIRVQFRYMKENITPSGQTLNLKFSQFSRIRTHQFGEETRIVTPVQLLKHEHHFQVQLLYGNIAELQRILESFLTLERKSGPTLYDSAKALKEQTKIIEGIYNDTTFDLSRLDHRERSSILLPRQGVWCHHVKPMLKHRGLLQLTKLALYFQPVPNFMQIPVLKIEQELIVHAFKRVVKLSEVGLEVVVCKGDSLYLCFDTKQQRDEVSRILDQNLKSLANAHVLDTFLGPQEESSAGCSIPNSNPVLGGMTTNVISNETAPGSVNSLLGDGGISNLSGKLTNFLTLGPKAQMETPSERTGGIGYHHSIPLSEVKRMTSLWQSGRLSNFHYLDFINCASGRSVNDLSQYPIFPWVLTNYCCPDLDLTDRRNYRDLSKPLGAMNEGRLRAFKERMMEMADSEKFLYGTHYSTPAYVLYWLVRELPECMLRLHSGNFDNWNRLFHSIDTSFRATQDGSAVLMELIPQFFVLPGKSKSTGGGSPFGCAGPPGFSGQNGNASDNHQVRWLTNLLHITTQDGDLDNVVLPQWAKNDPDLFVQIQRAALESDIVSEALPQWIDLIFGHRSRGRAALEADNLFHPVCYLTDKSSAGYPDTSVIDDIGNGVAGGTDSQREGRAGGNFGGTTNNIGETFMQGLSLATDNAQQVKDSLGSIFGRGTGAGANSAGNNTGNAVGAGRMKNGHVGMNSEETVPLAVLETQIEEFGRVPFQIFSEPHPPKLKRGGKWSIDTLKTNPIMNEPWYVVVAETNKISTNKPSQSNGNGNGNGNAIASSPSLEVACGTKLSITSSSPLNPVSSDPAVSSTYSPSGKASHLPSASSFLRSEFTKVDHIKGFANANINDLSHNSNFILGACEDGCLKAANFESGVVRTFHLSSVPLKSVRVVTNEIVVSGGCDNMVSLFNIKSGCIIDRQVLHADTITCLALGEQKQIVSGSVDQMVGVWDIVDDSCLKPIISFDDLEDCITAVACGKGPAPISSCVAAGTSAGTVCMFDVRAGQMCFERKLESDSRVVSMYFGSNFVPNLGDSQLVALDASGNFRVWDIRKEQEALRGQIHFSGDSGANCSGAGGSYSASGQQYYDCHSMLLPENSSYCFAFSQKYGQVLLYDIVEHRERKRWKLDPGGLLSMPNSGQGTIISASNGAVFTMGPTM